MTASTSPAPTDQGTHRALRLALGAAAVVVLLLGVAQLSKIVGPFFLALNLMIVIWPVQRFLGRRIPKVLAAIVSGLLAIVIIGLFFWAIGWAASLFVQEIPNYKGQFQDMYNQVLDLAAQYGITSSQILDQLKGINPGSVVSVVSSLISNVGGALSLFVVVITVLLFMVVDSIDFESRLERLGQRHNPTMVLALQSFARGVRSYWVTATVFGLVVSVLTWAGLAIYGIPLAIVWAVLSFVTNYIPNIGFIIGLVPAVVMGLLAKGPIGAVYVIVLYAVLNFVIQSVIQPKIVGEAVGVTATVSFLSLLVWAVVLGPLGALLALPATLFVKALVVDADPRARWINALIASNPKSSAEEPAFEAEQAGPVDPLVAQPAPVTGDADQVGTGRRGLVDEDAPDADENADEEDGALPRRSAPDAEETGSTDETAEAPAVEEGDVASDEPGTGDEAVASAEPFTAEEPAGFEEPAVDEPGTAEGPEADEPGAEELAAEGPVAVETAEEVTPSDEVQDETSPEPGVESSAGPVDSEDDEPEVPSPRRARADLDLRDVEEPEDLEGPVFQKSATPYWHSTVSHAED